MKNTRNTPVGLREKAHPVLYEINTRVLIGELSLAAGKAVTLGTIPESLLEEWERYGIDAVWLMGVWSTGPAGIAIASVVFAALHGFEYRWHWQYLLLVFSASLVFGWTRARWNSTGASTLLHAGYNLMFFIGYLVQGRMLPTHG